LNAGVNSTSIGKHNNSLNEDLLKQTKNMVFKLKPTPLKNWKNKCKVHLNFKKSNQKTPQMDFEVENE
jgi:hypothetical protein